MSKSVIPLLVFMLVISCRLTGQEYDQYLYKHKIDRYTHLSNTGRLFIGSGAVLTSAGIIWAGMLSKDNDLSELELENRVRVSAIAAGVGIELMIGGFIMKSIGRSKVRQYQEKLNNLSGGIIYSPQCKGFSLVYRF